MLPSTGGSATPVWRRAGAAAAAVENTASGRAPACILTPLREDKGWTRGVQGRSTTPTAGARLATQTPVAARPSTPTGSSGTGAWSRTTTPSQAARSMNREAGSALGAAASTPAVAAQPPPWDPSTKVPVAVLAAERERERERKAAVRTATPVGTRSQDRTAVGAAARGVPAEKDAAARTGTPIAGRKGPAARAATPTTPRLERRASGTGLGPRRGSGKASLRQAAEDSADSMDELDLPPGAVQPVAMRKRLARIPRSALGRASATNGPSGKITGAAVRCMTTADTTVWCAEASGNITIREKNGTVFGVVRRAADSAAITGMVFVPGSNGASRVVVGHANGAVAALDAGKGERKSGDVPVHRGAVTAMAVLPYCGGVVTAGEDGTVVALDPANLSISKHIGTAAAPVTAVAAAPFKLYTATSQGEVQTWDMQRCVPRESTTLRGGACDLIYTGKYLWVGCRAGPVTVLDSTDLSTVASLGKHDTHARIVQCSNASVWSFHANGAVNVWNAQTLELTRSMKCGAAGPTNTLARVTTVPEDVEIWTCNPLENTVRTWRDAEYAAPVWCVEALEEANDRAASLQRDLAAANKKLAAAEATQGRLHGGAAEADGEEAAALRKEIEVARSDHAAKLDAEAVRRKRAEAELGELKALVVGAYKQVYCDTSKASRSNAELRDMIAMLREAAGRSVEIEEDAQQAAEEMAVLRAEHAEATARLSAAEEQAAELRRVTAQLEPTQFQLDTALKKLARSEAEKDNNTAEMLFQQQQLKHLAQREKALLERERVQYEATEELAQKEAEIAEMEHRLMTSHPTDGDRDDSPTHVLPASVLPDPIPPEPQATALLDVSVDCIVHSGVEARRLARERSAQRSPSTRGPVNLSSPPRHGRASPGKSLSPALQTPQGVAATPLPPTTPVNPIASPYLGVPITPASLAALGERERQVVAAEQGLMRLKELLDRKEAAQAQTTLTPCAGSELLEREHQVGIAETGLRELRASLTRREDALRRREQRVADGEEALRQQQAVHRGHSPSPPPPPGSPPPSTVDDSAREASLTAREHKVRGEEALLDDLRTSLEKKEASLKALEELLNAAQTTSDATAPLAEAEGDSPVTNARLTHDVESSLLDAREEQLLEREQALNLLQRSLEQREDSVKQREEDAAAEAATPPSPVPAASHGDGDGTLRVSPERLESLVERERLVEEREGELLTLQQRLEEAEEELAVREAKVAHNLAAVEELESVHKTHEAALQTWEERVVSRERSLETLLAAREGALKKREAQVAEDETVHDERNALYRGEQDALAEQQAAVKEQQRLLRGREEDLAAREAAVAAAEEQSADDEKARASAAPSASATALRAREKELVSRERALGAREQALLAREADLIDREDALAASCCEASPTAGTDPAVTDRAARLDLQEAALAEREAALAAKEEAAALVLLNEQIAAQDAAAPAGPTPEAMGAWEQSLTEQQKALDEREAAVAAAEASLEEDLQQQQQQQQAVLRTRSAATLTSHDLNDSMVVSEGTKEDSVAEMMYDLRQALAARDATIAALQEDVARYVEQVAALVEAKASQPAGSALASLHVLEEELLAKEESLADMQEQLRTARNQAADLERRLAGKQAALDAAENSMRLSQEALQEACRDADKLQTLKDETAKQSDAIADLEAERRALVADLERAREQPSEHRALASCQADLRDCQAALEFAENRIHTLVAEADVLKSRAREPDADRVVALQSALEIEKNKCMQLARDAAAERRDFQCEMERLRGQDAKMAARGAVGEAEELRVKIATLERDKARLKDMLEKLNKAQKKVNEHLRIMGTQVEEKDKYIAELLQQQQLRQQ